MQQDQFQELTISSKDALAWAFARALRRSMLVQGSPVPVSAVDLLTGVFLAHPDQSEPYQLLNHFHIPVKVLYDALREQGGFAPDDAGSTPEPLKQMPPLDSEADSVLNRAFALSKEFNPESDRLVRLRDLFGGILSVPNTAAALLQRPLLSAGVPFEKLVAAYPEFLVYPSRDRPFSKFLSARFPSAQTAQAQQSEVSPAIRFAVSGFSSDTRTEKDLIGIGAEVDAFAYLMAAKALKPPMAIGLFGDWGSGKSFFMEALRQRIHKITLDAQQSGQPQEKISIYKYVAQIEFNAWHYVEGELWASLVEHIFRNLKTRPEDEPTLLQQRQQVLIQKLEVARRGQQAAQALKLSLEKQLAETKATVTTLEKERDAALKTLNDLKATDILAAVQLSSDERAAINQTLQRFGVTKTYSSAADLMQATDELRAVLQRGNALTTPLREHGWAWIAALIGVILIGPAISLALSRIGDVPSVTNALASVSAFLSGLTIVLKQGSSWLSSSLDRVDDARLRLDARRRETEARYAGDIAAAERAYSAKAAAYDQAKNQELEKEREVAELEQELRQITPGRVLLDFISERVGSQDYRKHLGIAALIRSDFEQLSKLIADENDAFEKRDDGKVREKDRHMINRIILYIDDLDRCPPGRVVDVLQAVHLLLAFPLFVVVVAVDARWLSQSLQAQYQNLLTTGARRDGLELSDGFGRQASPQDYLEKIFQIPFWVRPLPDEARMRIVRGLVAKSLTPPPAVSAPGREEPPTTGQTGATETDAAKAGEDQAAVTWDASERRRPLNMDAATDLKPQGLDIEGIELQFMDELQSLLGQTPRSVKRFVNVYRLIKAVSLDRMATFVEDKPDADFKLVLFLLAVLTGLPAIAREFFRLLRVEGFEIEQEPTPVRQASGPTAHTLAHVLDALRDVVANAPEAVANGAAPDGQGVAVTLEPAADGHRGSQGYENWYALRDLDRLEKWLKQHDHGRWLHSDATALAGWTAQVSRYSYRIEEL